MRFSALALLPLLTLAVACDNSDDDEGNGPIIIEDTGDGEPEETFLEPTRFAGLVLFAYDAGTMQTRSAVQGINEIPPAVLLIAANDAWTGSLQDTTNACTVELVFEENMSEASWVDVAGAVFGFSPTSVTVSGDSCANALDPAVYSTFSADLAALDWGFSLEAEMDSSTSSQLTMAGVDVSNFIGAGMAGDFGAALDAGGYLHAGIGRGNPVDGSWSVDQGTDMAPEDMLDMDDALQTGFYTIELPGLQWSVVTTVLGY